MTVRTAVLVVGGLVVALLLLSPLLGDDGFQGTFRGEIQGGAVTAVLKEDGDKLTGTIEWAGARAEVDGTIDGDRATGTVREPTTGMSMRFEAALSDDTLDWRYPRINLGFDLKREGSNAAAAPAASDAREPRLVGKWRRTASGRTGVGPNRLIMSTDVFCTLAGDGTFTYGGAAGGAVGPGSWPGVMTGPAATTRGEWKTDGSMLHTKVAGGAWLPVGRYSISGSGLVIYPAGGGEATYWERQ